MSKRVMLDWSIEQVCSICKRRLRRGRHPSKENPNTVPHSSHGLCSTCRYRSDKGISGKTVTTIAGYPSQIINNDGNITCRYCKEVKHFSLFCKTNGNRATSLCKRCEPLRQHRLLYTDFLRLMAAQNSSCEVCNTSFDYSTKNNVPHIDHDHRCCPNNRSCGDCIRGLLCMFCNNILGFSKENKDVLYKLAYYLDKNQFRGDSNDRKEE